MSEVNYILLFIITPLALILGWIIGHLRSQKSIYALKEENTGLKTTLELERKSSEEKFASLKESREELSSTFHTLSNEALKHNNETFLKLANENLKQFQIKAQGDLEQREKSVENMIKPIKEALEKTEKQIHQVEKDRKEAYGSLTQHLETMAQTQQLLHGETRNLAQALRRPEVRGQWGELTLKRLAELAGMVEHCDFYEQEHTKTDSGNLRPDMIVRMPDGREIIVDVKTPLDAYLNAVEASDDTTRNRELERHARNVRERMKELSAKAYWSQFKNAPDFVVLFIPGDQFLSSALERDRGLLEDALQQKVILATPTSFVALLRAVAYGWRQETLAENADKIRDLGVELYTRMATFTEHLAKVGKSLDNSMDHYNKAVGSLERQIMPSARKFEELGIQSRKSIEDLEPLEKSVRKIESEKKPSE